MLFEALDRVKRTVVMTVIYFMFFGLVLLVVPESSLPLLGEAVGFVLSVSAVLAIFDFIASKRVLIDCLRLVMGLFKGVIGVMIVTFDGFFSELLWWAVCTLPVILGGLLLYHAFTFARRSGRRGWWVLVLLAMLLLVFAILVLWNPWNIRPVHSARIVGGVLSYDAVVSALSLVWIWPTPTVNGQE